MKRNPRRVWAVLLGCVVVAVWAVAVLRLTPAATRMQPSEQIMSLLDPSDDPRLPSQEARAAAQQPHESARVRPPEAAALVTLDDLAREPESEHLVYRATEQAISRCMAKRNFQYRPLEFDEDAQSALAFEHHDAEDLDAAKAVGYGFALGLERGDSDTPGPDPNAEVVASLAPDQRAAYMRALLGETQTIQELGRELTNDPNYAVVSSAGGPTLIWDRRSCISEAQRALYGDDIHEQELRSSLSSVRERLAREVAAHGEVRRSTQHWQGCMREHGRPYEQPEAAGSDLVDAYHAGKLKLDDLRRAEIEVASLDARCRREARLASAKQRARDQLKLEVAREHQPLLAQLVRMNRESVAAATTLLYERTE